MNAAKPLREVIGDGVRRLREASGKTQEDVSRAARSIGLAWPPSKIAALERGEKSISPEEMFLLPPMLEMAFDREVSYRDLFTSDVTVTLSPKMKVQASELRAVFSSDQTLDFLPTRQELAADAMAGLESFRRKLQPITARLKALDLPTSFMELQVAGRAAQGLAEERAARKIGEQKIVVAAIALKLWGRGLTEERDARLAESLPNDAPPATVQAKRGRITRDLVAEITAYITAREDGDGSR